MSSQPTWPTYHGPPLPKTLQWYHPIHWWLLFLWVFFQPSKLKQYLYQADPELYHRGPGKGIFLTLGHPAYRNLYLVALITTTCSSLILSFPIRLSLWIVDPTLAWTVWAIGVAVGVTIGVVFGVIIGITIGVIYGVTNGVVFGVAYGLSFGISFGLAGGVSFGMIGDIVDGVTISMAGGIAIGVSVGVAYGMSVGVAYGVAIGMFVGLFVGLSISMSYGVAVGVVGGIAGFLGGSRTLFQLFLWPWAWKTSLPHHPAWGDELAVWPLPYTRQRLSQRLETDWAEGVTLATQLAVNPFQRGFMQWALSMALANQTNPLNVLYQFAQTPALAEYLTMPLNKRMTQDIPAKRIVLLGELGQTFVDGTGGISPISEYLVWRLTKRYRDLTPTPLSRFCLVLYELLRDEAELAEKPLAEIDLARYTNQLEAIRHLPHGDEVANSFAAMHRCLQVQQIDQLVIDLVTRGWAYQPTDKPPLRPAVMQSLLALQDICQEIAIYQQATSMGHRSAALNRAAGLLEQLAHYVAESVLPPEQGLLKRIISHWRDLISAQQGLLGQAALQEMSPTIRRQTSGPAWQADIWTKPAQPYDNPYVAGKPVYPPLFVGRVDIFNQIDAVWAAKETPDSIILYGHRRMGKTSILRNLNQVVSDDSVIVYVDLQGESAFIDSTADLLRELTAKLHYAANITTPLPNPTEFKSTNDAHYQFNRMVELVHRQPHAPAIFLALDEFETVDVAVEQGKISAEIYPFLRSLAQSSHLTLILGGLHLLDEMSRDYKEAFHGSFVNIHVSYLTYPVAWQLITNPVAEFWLEYEPAAVEQIIQQSGRQPYLIQQLCRAAIEQVNHELFDLKQERQGRITLTDVETVLQGSFFEQSSYYFEGVWSQTQAVPQIQPLLRNMSHQDEPWSFESLATICQLDRHDLLTLLTWAKRHDILYQPTPDQWAYCVPLMRTWVQGQVSS